MKKLLITLIITCMGYGLNAQLNWQKVIEDTTYLDSRLGFSPTSYNRQDNLVYSIANHWSHSMVLQVFDLNEDSVYTIEYTDPPNEMYEHTYDYENQRLIGMRSGYNSVFSLDVNGGAWMPSGSGSSDNTHYGGRSFWNSNTNSIGFFGGYGGYSTKNDIWENSGSGWSNVYPNNNDCNPARRVGYQMVLSEPNQNELFIFSGQGNCNGNQFETSCNLSDPWATDVGTYCWLKDLWRLNLDTYEFTNLLPVNESSVQVYGTLTYDYLDSTFYLIGGYTPPEVYDNQFSNNNTFELNVFKFKPGIDSGFQLQSCTGDLPPEVLISELGVHQLFFDGNNNRLVWIRGDGTWSVELCPSSSSVANVQSCDSFTWIDNNTYTESNNSAIFTTTNIDGCDSTIHLNLTILNSSSSSLSETVCDSYTGPDGNEYTESGNYTITLINNVGCDSTISMDLIVNSLTSLDAGVDQTVCEGNDVTLTATGASVYDWDNGVQNGVAFSAQLGSFTYTVEGTDSNGCEDEQSVTITGTPYPELTFEVTDPACQGESSGNVLAVVINGTAPYSFVWNNGTLQAENNGIGAGTYEVTVTDDNGCETPGSVVVIDPTEPCFYIPGGLTPNGDGANETWEIGGLSQFPDAIISVFDRWGQKVYSGDYTSPPWDGTSNGNELPTADYYYILDLGNGEKYNGVVTLKR